MRQVVILASWTAGVGVTLAAAGLFTDSLRPFTKSLVRGYMLISDKTRYYVAEGYERVQDLYAEAKYEQQKKEQVDNPVSGHQE